VADERPAEEQPAGGDAERDADQAPDAPDEFAMFEALVEKGVPGRVAVAAIAASRAEGEDAREKLERFADEFWTWFDMEFERRHPPTRNGRRPAPWRPFSPAQAWREVSEGGRRSG
jgi:hypothetical protein